MASKYACPRWIGQSSQRLGTIRRSGRQVHSSTATVLDLPISARARPRLRPSCSRDTTRTNTQWRSISYAKGLTRSIPQASETRRQRNFSGSPSAHQQQSQFDTQGKRILQDDDLFHSFTNSPIPEIRRRAAYIKQHAYCPHSSHRPTRTPTSPADPEAKKSLTSVVAPAHVSFECPDCGIPIACCEEHWADDYESHLEICDTLREINEDDHDLRSGRAFHEFEYPHQYLEEALVNLTNWDTYLYTRQYTAVNEERSLRQVTRLLTYPLTVASVLDELSPYNIRNRGRLTPEGLKSLGALRYTLHPDRDGSGYGIKGLRPDPPPLRIFILGARAESSLPREVWAQLAHQFPRAKFHLIFIGPESMTRRDAEFPLPPRSDLNPFGGVIEDRLLGHYKITTYVDYFHTMHQANAFYPYDPYLDFFVLFHPGLGHPASSHEWEDTLPMLLETKVPILATGYTDWDMQRDIDWVMERAAGEVDILLEPGENRFRSLRWDLNDLDPQDISCANWGNWMFRGKRYETTKKELPAQ